MSLMLDESGALVDLSDEAVVAAPRSDELAAYVASCVSGNVLNAALQLGTVRQAVVDAGAAFVGTYEPDADVIAYVGASDVTQLDLSARADFATAAAAAAWDSAIFDMDPTDAYEDDSLASFGSPPSWQSTLGATFARLGQRVVIISDRNDIDLSGAGFVLANSRLFGETYVHLFDSISDGAYDPAPFGTVLNPGFGWE